MKSSKSLIYVSCLIFGIFVFFSCSTYQTNYVKRLQTYRLIHNNDGSDILANRWFKQKPLTIANVDSCVDMVANTQVTTYMICSGSDFFYYRSKYGRVLGDDLNGTLNCGIDTAQYRTMHRFYLNFLNLENAGTDMIETALNRAKAKGMEAFITYRMNDLHFNDTTYHCPIFYSDFWIHHPQYWVNDTIQGYHSAGAFDFAHKEVREQKFAIISEQLDKYDMIDGIDLDFMRFFVYFKPNEGAQNSLLMTQLLRDIRKKVNEVSARRHKKILLSARVAPTLKDNVMKGLDIREWLKEGLLDFISIGVHWRGDPAMPVQAFRKELGKDLKIPFYCSVDDGSYKPRETYSHGMFRGMCSHILSQGADGIYLFNYYFGTLNSNYNGELHLERGGQVCRVVMPQLLRELGSLNTLEGRNKIYALSDGTIQYQMKPNSPLPIHIDSYKENIAAIYVGDDVKKNQPQEVIFFFRTDRPISCKIKINGKYLIKEMPSYTKLYDRELGLEGKDKEYAFVLPANIVKHGYNKIKFYSQEDSTFFVKRIEMALKYGDVKTHGYF
ncbi:MAG: hypothetical protein PHG27_05115 [Massilibacteroides sp.]|nr:hypothetical protein [Massilibacteroides sp.]